MLRLWLISTPDETRSWLLECPRPQFSHFPLKWNHPVINHPGQGSHKSRISMTGLAVALAAVGPGHRIWSWWLVGTGSNIGPANQRRPAVTERDANGLVLGWNKRRNASRCHVLFFLLLHILLITLQHFTTIYYHILYRSIWRIYI